MGVPLQNMMATSWVIIWTLTEASFYSYGDDKLALACQNQFFFLMYIYVHKAFWHLVFNSFQIYLSYINHIDSLLCLSLSSNSLVLGVAGQG